MKAMMTIADFAEFCGTTKDALRWYDKKGLLKPMHIGENGYRYYDMIQYEEYYLIHMMKESGSNLQEIGAILNDKTKYLNGAFFRERLAVMDEQIRSMEKMRTFVRDIVDGFSAMDECVPGEPTLVNLPETWLLEVKLDKTSERSEHDYVLSLMKIQQSATVVGNTSHLYPLGVKLSIKAAMENRLEQTHFFYEAASGGFPGAVYRMGGPAVTVWHRGYYEEIFSTLAGAFRYIEELGLRPCDTIYEYDFLVAMADKPENTTFRFVIPVMRDNG